MDTYIDKMTKYFAGEVIEFTEGEYKLFYETLRDFHEDERFDTEIEDDFTLGRIYRVKKREE